MDFKAFEDPLTLDTSCPHSATRVSSTPVTSSATGSVPVSASLSTGPPLVTSTSAPSTQAQVPESSSGYPNLLSLLPIFSLVLSHHVSIREALPLLQNSLLGMLNDNIRSHNETRDALFSALGLPPIPPRYTSPYATDIVSFPHSTAATPTPPPPPTSSTTQTTAPRDVSFDDTQHIITSEDLSQAFDAVSLPTIDSNFAALSELIAGLATSSGLPDSSKDNTIATLPEDAPIGTLRLVTSTGPASISTYSEVITASAEVDNSVPLTSQSSLSHLSWLRP